MRKFLLLISITFFTNVYSQYNRFEVGIESGPTFGKFWGTGIPFTFYQSKPAYILGTYFQINLNKFSGIRTGLYTERINTCDAVQFKNANDEISGTGEFSVQADDVTIPLLMQFGFGKKFRINFEAGTFFSYLLKYDVAIRYGKTYPYGDKTYHYTDQMNRFNTGLLLSAGIDYIFLQRMKVGIELRDQWGLLNMSRSGDGNFFGTNSFMVLARVGWML